MAVVHYVLKRGVYSLGKGGMGFVAGDVLPLDEGEHMAANHPNSVEVRAGEKPAAEPREISANYAPSRTLDAVPEALKEQVAKFVKDEAARLTGGGARASKAAAKPAEKVAEKPAEKVAQ